MNLRGPGAAFFAAGFVAIACNLLLPAPVVLPAVTPALSAAGPALWNDRTFEVLLQGFIILAGVLSILLLLVSGDRKERVS